MPIESDINLFFPLQTCPLPPPLASSNHKPSAVNFTPSKNGGGVHLLYVCELFMPWTALSLTHTHTTHTEQRERES